MSKISAICILAIVCACALANSEEYDKMYGLETIDSIESYDEWDVDRDLERGSCSCSGSGCKCCLSKHFKVNLLFKKYKFKLNACIDTEARGSDGMHLGFVVNGHQLYHKEISLVNPPEICEHVPGLKMARVCVQMYNINVAEKRLCARLTGTIDIKVKKFRVNLPFGCFKL